MGREPAGGGGLRVLVTGGAGLVGTHLLRTVPEGVHVEATWRTARPTVDVVAAHRVELDEPGAASELLERVVPDVVVHAAYSMGRREDVVDATRQVAQACAGLGVELVHLSSDVVFDGESAPYSEDDEVGPVNDYGRWKVEAERLVQDVVPAACITRTSLVVSSDPEDSGTRWLLGAVRAGERPTLFHDEVRSPIRAEDLARTLWGLVALGLEERAGIWHLPGPEALSRAELGRRVLLAAGLDPGEVEVGSVRDFPAPRARDVTMVTRRSAPGRVPSPVP